MRVESDFFHNYKIGSRSRNFGQHFFVTFELIAVSVFKSSQNITLCSLVRKYLFLTSDSIAIFAHYFQ
jgi:hypothetical protein